MLSLLTFIALSLVVLAEGKKPNILVLMADDWSWPHAGALGDRTVKTPTFDKLIR